MGGAGVQKSQPTLLYLQISESKLVSKVSLTQWVFWVVLDRSDMGEYQIETFVLVNETWYYPVNLWIELFLPAEISSANKVLAKHNKIWGKFDWKYFDIET